MKENYDAKFLQKIDFAFKELTLCLRRKNCKLLMQSLPVMMFFLLKQQEDLANLLANCTVVYACHCC